MKTIALIEKGADGKFGIFTPDIESTIIGGGDTVAEAKADFENSVKEIIDAHSQNGEPLPLELQNIEFEYKFDISSLFDYYKWINVSQLAKTAGLSSTLMRQHKAGLCYISESQTKKIERTLHKMGQELSTVKL
jgi:predicted RNase H-like HicB family nuclease